MSSSASPQFVHLRVHSEFSLVNGLVRIKPLAKKIEEDGIPAIALTDLSNQCAYVKFFKAVRGTGAKPILGADVFLENDDDEDAPYSMTLIARNHAGYQNLMELISKGFTEGQKGGRAL